MKRVSSLIISLGAVACVAASNLRHGAAPEITASGGNLTRFGNIKQTQTAGIASGVYNHPAWVQNCKAIYLDIGSNIGVQVRKLYEPEKYPGATVLPLFAGQFGAPAHRRLPASTSGICALGLEPNPEHYSRLDAISAAYVARGWNAHFYHVAAWSSDGQMNFKGAGELPSKRDWGARLDMPAVAMYDVNVPTVDIAAFINSLPAASIKLMKMDIEGAEYECISHLVGHNTLCQNTVNAAFAEAHAWGNVTNWPGDRSFTSIAHNINMQSCPAGVTTLHDLDDESYLHDVDNDPGGGYPLV